MKKPCYKIIFIVSLIVCSSCNLKNENKIEKPNILFVLMDDLGYGQFGIYNDTLETTDFDPFFVQLVDSLQGYSPEKALEFSKQAIPTLTGLSKSGVIFTKAYTSSNLCAPSRLGIATGTLQNRIGVYRNIDCEALGIPKGAHLAERLQRMGYKTAHIGKWHIGKRDEQMVEEALQRHGIKEPALPDMPRAGGWLVQICNLHLLTQDL